MLPLVFSATSEKSLRALVASYQMYLEDATELDIRGLAYTLACRRTPHAFKTSVPAGNHNETCAAIASLLTGDAPSFATRSANNRASMLGVFTGQGAQWAQMGAELVRASSYVRSIVAELDQSLGTLPEADRPQWTILDELLVSAEKSRVGEAAIAQPLTCAIQLVLIALLQDAGVQFRAVVGHSSGEIAAAHAAGFVRRHDAIRIAYYRGFHSYLAGTESGQPGAMLAAGTSLEDAKELCALPDFQGRIVVAASNSATSVTLSGDADIIEEAQNVLLDEDKFARLLRVDKAYHSHHMLRASEPFLASLQACGLQIQKPSATAPKWFSSVRAGQILDATAGCEGQYWTDNLNNPGRCQQRRSIRSRNGGRTSLSAQGSRLRCL
jgi:hybrid polyketide synthase/nonribosomal peptide synthetase ACE1